MPAESNHSFEQAHVPEHTSPANSIAEAVNTLLELGRRNDELLRSLLALLKLGSSSSCPVHILETTSEEAGPFRSSFEAAGGDGDVVDNEVSDRADSRCQEVAAVQNRENTKHCSCCHFALQHDQFCSITQNFCQYCAGHIFRTFDPAVKNMCHRCLVVGRKLRHWCSVEEFDIFGKDRKPFNVFFDRVGSALSPEPGEVQLLHCKFGLCEELATVVSPCSTNLGSDRYSVKFAGLPFYVEMSGCDINSATREIETGEELVDAIAEYHWCPNEHDLKYFAAGKKFVCYSCGEEVGRDHLPRLGCKICDFYLCGPCRLPAVSSYLPHK